MSVPRVYFREHRHGVDRDDGFTASHGSRRIERLSPATLFRRRRTLHHTLATAEACGRFERSRSAALSRAAEISYAPAVAAPPRRVVHLIGAAFSIGTAAHHSVGTVFEAFSVVRNAVTEHLLVRGVRWEEKGSANKKGGS